MGRGVIVSCEEMSELEYDVKNVRSIQNPHQCGMLDEYIAWVKEGYAGGNPLILAANKKSDEFAL